MRGLAPLTLELFDAVTRLDCIKPFVLVGGTALSLQLNARQSEDLDFMRWKQGPKDSLEVGWPSIKNELETIALNFFKLHVENNTDFTYLFMNEDVQPIGRTIYK